MQGSAENCQWVAFMARKARKYCSLRLNLASVFYLADSLLCSECRDEMSKLLTEHLWSLFLEEVWETWPLKQSADIQWPDAKAAMRGETGVLLESWNHGSLHKHFSVESYQQTIIVSYLQALLTLPHFIRALWYQSHSCYFVVRADVCGLRPRIVVLAGL